MKNLSLDERDQLIRSVAAAVAEGSLDLGGAVKRLRVEVTGLKQATFARMCKISMRALNHLEHGDGNPTLATLEAVFKPFGLRIGLARIEPIDLKSVLTKTDLDGFGLPSIQPAKAGAASRQRDTPL